MDDFFEKPANIDGAATLAQPVAAAPESPTVLAVDRWGMRRAEDIGAMWESVGADPHPREVIADAHTALFSPQPQHATRPADATRSAFFRSMMETPEYRALHNSTALNPELSELAAAQICREWASYAADQPDERAPDAPPPGSDAEPIADTLGRMRAVAAALKAAADEVEAARDCMSAFGMGGDGDGHGAPLDPKAFREHFRKVREDSTLRAIMELAGRMRAMARALQRQRVQHGRDDVVGVELGADVGRLIPAELLALCSEDPGIELLALQRIAERRAMCRDYRGIERKARGPVIVTVDESGSMNGPKVEAAKAMALALAWLAHHQRRWIMLVGYSGGCPPHCLIAQPGKLDPARLMDWCAHFYSGGTNRDVPIVELPELYRASGAPEGKTDLIMVTDAICALSQKQIRDFNEWRAAANVRAYSIIIESGSGALAEVSDRTFEVPKLSLDSFALSEVLSI